LLCLSHTFMHRYWADSLVVMRQSWLLYLNYKALPFFFLCLFKLWYNLCMIEIQCYILMSFNKCITCVICILYQD
jgi:hypothetical protein